MCWVPAVCKVCVWLCPNKQNSCTNAVPPSGQRLRPCPDGRTTLGDSSFWSFWPAWWWIVVKPRYCVTTVNTRWGEIDLWMYPVVYQIHNHPGGHDWERPLPTNIQLSENIILCLGTESINGAVQYALKCVTCPSVYPFTRSFISYSNAFTIYVHVYTS